MARITFNIIRRQVYIAFFTLVFLVLLPLCLIVFSPIYLFRFFLCILARTFRPDLGDIIDSRSSVLAIDDPSKSPKWNLCVWIVFEGALNFENFREFFRQNILNKKDLNGKLVYPEYQQYYTSWLGFLFWKWDEKFRLENHMRYCFEDRPDYLTKETTEEDVRKLVKELTWSPFAQKRSPWEMHFIPNYKSATNYESDAETKSVLIYRVHHGLCDGFKILHLIMTECNAVSMDLIAKPDYVKRSLVSRIWLAIVFWFKAPYEFFKILVSATDHNQWHCLPERRLVKPMNMSFTERIPLTKIKNLSKSYNVSFSAVLLASITGGIRRMMMDSGVRVPKNISTAFPVPMPGHPLKLRNHFIFCFMKLPVGVHDRRRRLLKMERNIRALKKSAAPIMCFGIVPIVGALTAWLQRLFNNNIYSTALLSNFPGPRYMDYFTAGGGANKVIDMNFGAGFGGGNVGLGFLMLSYAGGLRIISQADRSILPDDESVKALNQLVLDEMDQLEKDLIV